MINQLLGNATEVNADMDDFISEGETVEKAYKLIRDYYVFTNKRLIMIDVQGITGSKKEYHSIPYKSITHFSVETPGSFDLDSDIKIFITGGHPPFIMKIKKGLNVLEIEKVLASYVLSK